MAEKKYVGISALSHFLSKLKDIFALKEEVPTPPGGADVFYNGDGGWTTPSLPELLSGKKLQTTEPDHPEATTDKVAVIDESGNIAYRTNSEILSDIGADPSGKVGSENVGSETQPVYILEGVPTVVTQVGSASSADTANKLGTETVGSETQAIYLDAGVPKIVTKVESATNADIATKLGETTVGSATQPIYLLDGVPTAGNEIPDLSDMPDVSNLVSKDEFASLLQTNIETIRTALGLVTTGRNGLVPQLPADPNA